jgi:FAD synthase
VEALPTGIYYGWAHLPGRGVFKACASIGWNPQFANQQKTVGECMCFGCVYGRHGGLLKGGVGDGAGRLGADCGVT